jgi:glyoxylase-like metal-dependent hydrolase (beta-lactamase superfamily II)
MQLFPGIYMVANIAYGTGQNLYILDTGAGSYVMIDAGGDTAAGIATVEKVCSTWRIDMKKISHLLLTHSHFDHTCFAVDIQSLGAAVIAHKAAVEPLISGDERVAAYFFHQPFKTFKVDRTVSDGEVLKFGRLSITCIGAPGHSACSMVYHVECDGRNLVFTGDVIALGPGQTAELGWKGDLNYNPQLYIESLRKMRALKCDALLPGHGFPTLINSKALIDNAYGLAMTTLRHS